MKSIRTYADAGSIAIGTKEAWFLLPNGYGDGEFNTLVFDDFEEFDAVCRKSGLRGWRFLTTVQGTRLEIVDYDCPSTRPWFDGSVHDWTPIATLSGVFSAYNDGKGTIALVRLGDARRL